MPEMNWPRILPLPCGLSEATDPYDSDHGETVDNFHLGWKWYPGLPFRKRGSCASSAEAPRNNTEHKLRHHPDSGSAGAGRAGASVARRTKQCAMPPRRNVAREAN